MSTLILVGRIVDTTRDTASVWALGETHELRWGCPPLGELVRMVITPDDLVLIEARDGVLQRFELILSAPAGTGARMKLEDWPPVSARPGTCEHCHEAGWVVEAPEELQAAGGPANLLVLPPLEGGAA